MKLKSISIYIIFCLSLLINGVVSGQTMNDLNQKVTIAATNITISELLLRIGEKANIKFSYNPKVINAKKRINVIGEKKAVREILDEIFNDEFEYKLRGNYVIITDEKLVQEDTGSKAALISGYVVDDETLDGLPNVSIYTSAGESVITDEIGAFKIKLEKKDNSMIELRRKNYEPRSFETSVKNNKHFQIKLKPIKTIEISLERDSLTQVELPIQYKELKTMYKVNTSLKLNLENIQDTLYKPVSLSLYPGLSTYGNLSGNIIYNMAFNFVGYNRGIHGTEIAVFSNINKENVTGVQLAGLSNYTGGRVDGLQAAGIFNKISGSLEGMQMAGISNVNLDNIDGGQFAGISNHVSKEMVGLQMAGIYNQAQSMNGGQFAGIMNIINKGEGIQAAGIGNISKSVNGVQVAGIFNVVDTLEGTQISGILNIAKVIKGHQIGLVNVADSVSGIPIGLINFIKNGYKRIEVSTDELFPLNLSLKTGVRHFYSILTAGMQTDVFDNESSFYTFGFGIGSSLRLGNKLNIDFDVINKHITKKSFTDQLSNNIQGYLGLELKATTKLAIFGGGVYNAYYFDRALLEDSDFDHLRSSYLLDTSDQLDNDFIWRSWAGYRFGLRYII